MRPVLVILPTSTAEEKVFLVLARKRMRCAGFDLR